MEHATTRNKARAIESKLLNKIAVRGYLEGWTPSSSASLDREISIQQEFV